MADMMGPPAPRSRYDNLPELPRRKPKENDSPDILKDILIPLALSQGIDFLSTEKPLGFNTRSDTEEVANRFPGARSQGFAGTLGRTASNASELLLSALLSKLHPALGKASVVPMMTVHTDYAKKNWDMMDDLRRKDAARKK